MTVNEMADKLQRGDKMTLASITGYSLDYVVRIFSETRSMDAKGAKLILAAGKELIEFREKTTIKYTNLRKMISQTH